MLESLFAQAGQGQAFIHLTVGGFVLGALTHLSGCIRRGRRLLGALCDALAAVLMGFMLLGVLFRFGGGVRAYGLLGLLIGLTLYYAGFSRLAEALVRAAGRLMKRLQKRPA
ncbi:MAG: hypothetical protein IJ507_02710 [Clostridia bacterium]|nr:hypothetical protein [Clostridia bacterium]